jgi:hypothetical protein
LRLGSDMDEIIVEYDSLHHQLRAGHGAPSLSPDRPIAVQIRGLPDSRILNALVQSIRLMLDGGRKLTRIIVDSERAKAIVDLLGFSEAYGVTVSVKLPARSL